MYDVRPIDLLARTQPHILKGLEALDYVSGDLLARAGSPIDRVIFPATGLISLAVDLSTGESIEVAMVGRGGSIGGELILGIEQHICSSIAQVPGRAWVMESTLVLDGASQCAEFRQMLTANENQIRVQAQQTAACNARHSVMQRLCSWLLRAHHKLGNGEIFVTQERIAQVLGVQRASVSMFAAQLQERGLIRYRRGRLQVEDRIGLASLACECTTIFIEQAGLVRSQAEPVSASAETPRPLS